MTDRLISLQAAIDALDEIESEVADGYGYQYEKWRKYFCELPSAQPERKRGRWYDVGSLSCRCSECGCKSQKEFMFCPNCGADMRGEQNGSQEEGG